MQSAVPGSRMLPGSAGAGRSAAAGLYALSQSQPWRFYAGPTLALELSGNTAWLAGHANPAELAGFLSFCGCESAILDGTVCPPPDGWHKAEALTVFGLPQAGPLPCLPWTKLCGRSCPSAGKHPPPGGSSALPSRPRPAGRFYSELCTKRSRGRAVAWTLEQGSTVVCTVGAYACAMGRHIWPVGRPQSAAGQGHRRAAHCGNGKQPCRRRLRPVFLCAPERVRFYTRLGFAKQAEYARYVPEKC